MTPVVIDGWYIFLDHDRFEGYTGIGERASGEQEQRALLERAFPLHSLKWLPRAWGRSIGSLEGEAFDVVSENNVQVLQGVDPATSESDIWTTTSDPVYMEVDIGASGISGTDVGLLVLSSDFPKHYGVRAEIGWSSDTGRDQALYGRAEVTRIRCFLGDGDHIIPLDASPDWLLGYTSRLTIRLYGVPVGTEMQRPTVRLGQRRGVEEIDRLANEP